VAAAACRTCAAEEPAWRLRARPKAKTAAPFPTAAALRSNAERAWTRKHAAAAAFKTCAAAHRRLARRRVRRAARSPTVATVRSTADPVLYRRSVVAASRVAAICRASRLRRATSTRPRPGSNRRMRSR